MNQIAQKGVGSLQFLFEGIQRRKIKIQHRKGLDIFPGKNWIRIQTRHLAPIGGRMITGAQGRLTLAADFEGGTLFAGRISVVQVFETFLADKIGFRHITGLPPDSQYLELGGNHQNSPVESVNRF